MADKYYPQTDILKCFAIISVVIIHSVSPEFLKDSYAVFHFWQAVPVFLVIMGINLAVSYSKRNFSSLNQYYSWNNMVHRIKRVIPMFMFIFIAGLIWGLIRGNYYIGWKTFLGYIPIPSPGNVFLSVILQMVIVAPALVYFYRKYKIQTIIFCFVSNLLFELIALHVFTMDDKFFYYSFFVRTLAIVVLGLYVGEKLINGKLKNIFDNGLIKIGIVFSSLYLMIASASGWKFPYFIEDYGTQNILAIFYPMMLVILIMQINFDKLKDGVVFKFLCLIGKASYHILLVQMLYFGLRYGSYANQMQLVRAILVNIFITVGFGILFYYGEQYGEKIIRKCYAYLNSSRIRLA